ncbi:TetR/AcrR family transcriptional regulator [Cytobacillus firmus]|uniref:TetR/AcrR family transcriptional regulator n=1 Tax=Cytobacillus firmus TaxID=1399 RepID=UPI00077C64ED|nr:TetR/AcrR family transcriptional regulator [Cytobacillus firmus]MBG9543747.1 TetR family transcriptional regulator [Cytobacillus firmus]MBG9548225.1 TetR family transcriptional regulator [Cytobacillus firmus]MBG9553235.1 TetR family transcriptional regulator [Cytobacillus firmus]MBG9556822.1 TetR family transcriptional regulator [Cytobacillus firmus]MBG9601720.1 TetR family transcriptional regulator [Cytobacillus firmus]
MPKKVDHEKQKKVLAKAAWRVIKKEGIEGASVRKIAKEAGLSAGSLRHYFSNQSELLAYSMNLVSERVKTRIQNAAFTEDHFENMILVLGELLPLDEERRLEMEVWIAFNIKALVDPNLAELSSRVYDEMKEGIRKVIEGLKLNGISRSDLNAGEEVERLYALVDGLALHAVMNPDHFTESKMKGILRTHLLSLC